MWRKGGRAGLPARVSGRHVVRGRQSSPTLEVRLGEQARLVKTVKIQVGWAAARPGRDLQLQSVATHSGLWRATSVRSRVGIVLEDGSGVAVDWVSGRSCSSARRRLNVQSGQRKGRKVAAAPYLSVAVRARDTDKVLREADGSVKLVVVRPHTDGKVFAAGCASKTGRWEPVRSPKNTSGSKDVGRKSSFCVTDGHLSSEKCWIGGKAQKYKGRVVFRGDIVKDDSGAYAVFTEQGSSASQMTAAKVMDIISSLPGCDGQAADAVSAYTQVKMEDAHKLKKIPKSECPDIWIRLPRHKWPKSWSSMEDPVVPLERNLYGHPLAGLL